MNKLALGHWGVRMFFVLSGFLITGILIKCRDSIDQSRKDQWLIIKNFYIRRCLRLMPIYYLTILVTSILFFSEVKPLLIWHLTYTSNFYFFWHQWEPYTSHFWALAVEQQFYLVWPFLILLTPRKYIAKLISITILIGPLFRLLMVILGYSNGDREYLLIFACLDSLGLGSLLSLLDGSLF